MKIQNYKENKFEKTLNILQLIILGYIKNFPKGKFFVRGAKIVDVTYI